MASSIASSPIQIPCKAVLFDMDGILISSVASVERSWTKWALMRGIDPESAIRAAHGCRAIETVAHIQLRGLVLRGQFEIKVAGPEMLRPTHPGRGIVERLDPLDQVVPSR